MERKTPTTKEKLCAVQPFVEGFWDIGNLLASQSQLNATEIKTLMDQDPEAYEKLEDKFTPRDIDLNMKKLLF